MTLPVCAGHDTINITGCSDSAKAQILDVQYKLEKQGYKAPPYITCDLKVAEKTWKEHNNKNINFKEVNGYYLPSIIDSYDSVFVRENSKSMTILRILTHEAGHYNSRLLIGLENYVAMFEYPVPEELKPKITFIIREYATTSRPEYVAEYFSYSQMGVRFPKDMRKLYKESGGP